MIGYDTLDAIIGLLCILKSCERYELSFLFSPAYD